jgi:hypothetical protein
MKAYFDHIRYRGTEKIISRIKDQGPLRKLGAGRVVSLVISGTRESRCADTSASMMESRQDQPPEAIILRVAKLPPEMRSARAAKSDIPQIPVKPTEFRMSATGRCTSNSAIETSYAKDKSLGVCKRVFKSPGNTDLLVDISDEAIALGAVVVLFQLLALL